MNQVKLALNICTYKREQILKENLNVLKESEFFNPSNSRYYNKLEIFVIDNASELSLEDFPNLHLFHNPNTGGSGGFQRGIEEIRKYNDFTHVIFMDDDVSFETSCFYILYDFLEEVDGNNAERPVAGRMLDKDNPNIQWTAAEKWNGGDIKHIEFLRDISDLTNPYTPGKAKYDIDADYGGFWFCCYPYSYVKDNDILPFFLHCDDVEYGLRYRKKPIIIEGVHVWHETWDKKMTSAIKYYDMRNSLFVNALYNISVDSKKLRIKWENGVLANRLKKDYASEYMLIKAMDDYLDGLKKLEYLCNDKHHKTLLNRSVNGLFNKIYYAIVRLKYSLKNGV